MNVDLVNKRWICTPGETEAEPGAPQSSYTHEELVHVL